MAKRSSSTSRPIFSFLLGVVGTLVVLGGYYLGLGRRAELHALDWRLRRFCDSEAPGGLLHVDIDDGSLDELGRWPWPRETLAGIIDSLKECGARAVVLDIILPEPQKVRWADAAEQLYGPAAGAMLSDAPPVPVFDDAILARSIRRGGATFLPCYIDFDAPAEPTGEHAINTRVRDALAVDPKADFQAVLSKAPSDPRKITGEQLEIIDKAYLRNRAIMAMRRFALPDEYTDRPTKSGPMVPPLVTFVAAASGSGFVTFQPDEDGAVRRIPLLGESGGRIYPQFALAVAAAELGRRGDGECSILAIDRGVTLACPDGTRRVIPTDSDGAMLIRWASGSWTDSRGRLGDNHIPAAAAAEPWRQAGALARLDDLAHALRIKFLSMGMPPESGPMEKQFRQLARLTDEQDDLYRRRTAAEFRTRRSLLYSPSQTPHLKRLAELKKNEQAVQRKVQAVAVRLVEQVRRPENLKAFLDGDEAQARRTLELLDGIPARREKMAKALKAVKAELARKVNGKICLVGSTATGAADFVPTPLAARTPGVVVHCNIVNTILRGEFLSQAPAAVNLFVIIAAGLLVAIPAAVRPVIRAALWAMLLAGGFVAFNAWIVFNIWGVWLDIVAPVAAMLAAFLLVTVYRQLTEERAKRHIRGMFAHALSPALVDSLLADPSLAELGGQQREITCMFSDLAGFTPLAERLGPNGTVRLLNRYFDRVTDTVQSRGGGYINKFLGDGIFAFFGAPVFQADHPARAVHAAMDYQDQLRAFNADLAGEADGQVRLSVRIGVATGEAMVGNCGSTQRMDYTAIGDCVNLASRLEAANKFFGTRIIVTDHTWRRLDSAELLARPLGRIIVTGQSEPVAVWNVLARRDEATPQQRDAAELFARAMDAFGKQDFNAAKESFLRCQKLLPDDGAARVFLELIDRCLVEPALLKSPGCEVKGGKGVAMIAWPWK